MTDAKREEIENWLTKGQHDLGAARRVMEGDPPYLDVGVYHCQQAAEKALKALLTYQDVPFEKTHNLTVLLEMARDLEPGLDAWRGAAARLTPYAIRFRYPSDVLEPGLAEASAALREAEAFVGFITGLLAPVLSAR